MDTCPVCGHRFEADRCPFCEATSREIDDTLLWCFRVSGASFLANLVVNQAWPWLQWAPLTTLLILALLFSPLIINFVLVYRKQYVPRAALSKRISIGSAALAVLYTAFSFLNVALDQKAPQEVQATVVSKAPGFGKSGGPYLVLSLSWNQERIEQSIKVSQQVLSGAEPGGDVRLVIHPGAFSQPWYSDVLLDE